MVPQGYRRMSRSTGLMSNGPFCRSDITQDTSGSAQRGVPDRGRVGQYGKGSLKRCLFRLVKVRLMMAASKAASSPANRLYPEHCS